MNKDNITIYVTCMLIIKIWRYLDLRLFVFLGFVFSLSQSTTLLKNAGICYLYVNYQDMEVV